MDKSSSKKSAPLVASNQEPAMSEEEKKLRKHFPQVYEVIGKAKMYEQQVGNLKILKFSFNPASVAD
jgi:hypothetical protein